MSKDYFIKHNGNLLYAAMLIARSNGVVVAKFVQKEAAALKIKPPFQRRVKMRLRYDGFFSFTVVRQIFIFRF